MGKTFSSLLIVLLTTILLTGIVGTETPVAAADTQQNVETATTVTVDPNPAVFGQTVQINVSISPPPPTMDDYFSGIIIEITNPKGDNTTIGPLKASPDWQDKTIDTIWVNYVPGQAGTFKITAYYEGDTYSDGGIAYLPSTSNTVSLNATWEVEPQPTPTSTQTPTQTTSTPTPTATPWPTPTATPPPTPTPTPQIKKTASLSIETENTVQTTESPLIVKGRLIAPGTIGIAVQDITISYSTPNNASWKPIGIYMTNEWGMYSFRWMNPISGTFLIKAEWTGNSEYQAVSNTTTISRIPIGEQQAIIQSNSTITQLNYNQTVGLSFTVSGETGTEGYAQVVVPKSLMTESQNIKVRMDGKAINFVLTTIEDSWIISFTYQHSMHQVVINANTNSLQGDSLSVFGDMLWVYIGSVVAALAVASAVIVWLAKTRKK